MNLSALEREVSLHSVGDGPDRTRLEFRSAELGLAHVVHFYRRDVGEEYLQIVHGETIVTLPRVTTKGGRWEGIPDGLLDALAKEKAVFVSDLQIIPKLQEDTLAGPLVNPRGAIDLAKTLDVPLQDQGLRNELGPAATERVLSGFISVTTQYSKRQ